MAMVFTGVRALPALAQRSGGRWNGISVLIVAAAAASTLGLEDREKAPRVEDLRRAGQPRCRSPRGVRFPSPSYDFGGLRNFAVSKKDRRPWFGPRPRWRLGLTDLLAKEASSSAARPRGAQMEGRRSS